MPKGKEEEWERKARLARQPAEEAASGVGWS